MTTREIVETKDLKKGVTYYLHGGWEHYFGTPVKLVEILKVPKIDKGKALVRGLKGGHFLVGRGDGLFKEDPLVN